MEQFLSIDTDVVVHSPYMTAEILQVSSKIIMPSDCFLKRIKLLSSKDEK